MPIHESSVGNTISSDTRIDNEGNEGSLTAHNVQPGDAVFVTHRLDSTFNVSQCYFFQFYGTPGSRSPVLLLLSRRTHAHAVVSSSETLPCVMENLILDLKLLFLSTFFIGLHPGE